MLYMQSVPLELILDLMQDVARHLPHKDNKLRSKLNLNLRCFWRSFDPAGSISIKCLSNSEEDLFVQNSWGSMVKRVVSQSCVEFSNEWAQWNALFVQYLYFWGRSSQHLGPSFLFVWISHIHENVEVNYVATQPLIEIHNIASPELFSFLFCLIHDFWCILGPRIIQQLDADKPQNCFEEKHRKW